MTRADKRIDAFLRCKGSYPWRDFVALLKSIGYELVKAGHTGGSRRKFIQPKTGHMIWADEPHDGQMKKGMVKRLRENLQDGGVL